MFLNKIPKYINSRTFNIQHNNYRISIVEDLKGHYLYVLKGNLSSQWENAQSYEDFLFNLRCDKKFKGVISTESKNFEHFCSKLVNFFLDNKIISNLVLELNYKCNQKCKHCFNPKNMDDYSITFKQAKKIIDEAYLSNIYAITLTGGECTINKDFYKIAKYVRDKHMELCILTNGQKLYDDKKLFNKIISIYPTSITLSLYSMIPEIHDNITGIKNSHHKTLKVIKSLQENSIKVNISCPQLSYNTESYKDVKLFAEKIGAGFAASCSFIYNKKNNNFSAKCKFKDIENYYINTLTPNEQRLEFIKNNKRICSAGTKIISIRPNLDITPCVGFNYILGNYTTTSLKELQTNILPKFREIYIKSNLKECFKYDYCKYCSYCSLLATNESGFLKKCPTLCEDAKAYYKVYLKHKCNNC